MKQLQNNWALPAKVKRGSSRFTVSLHGIPLESGILKCGISRHPLGCCEQNKGRIKDK